MSKRPRKSFSDFFAIACELSELKPELFGDKVRGNLSPRDRKRGRILEDAITPAAKRAPLAPKIAARERLRKLTALMRRYVRRFGPPSNVSAFIKKLRDKGLLKTHYAAGRSFTPNDITVRRILRKLGAQGDKKR